MVDPVFLNLRGGRSGAGDRETGSSVIRYEQDRYHVDEFIRLSMRNSEIIQNVITGL